MNKPCTRTTVVATIAVLALLQGIVLPVPAAAATASVSNVEAARIVRATYARLADYTVASGTPLGHGQDLPAEHSDRSVSRNARPHPQSNRGACH
jgi:hypothetical protein